MEKKGLKIELYECPDGDYISLSNGECFVNIELENGNGFVAVDRLLGLLNISRELDKAREEGFADGVELEQLLNAEFFGEDYQNPKRLKELKKKYNFEDNK